MNYALFVNRTILLVVSLMLFLLILPISSPAADPKVGGRDLAEEHNQGLNQIAVESVEDSQKACLNRIPADASTGQRMLAEQNCQQIESDRKGIHLTF